ncbi:MAG: helix-turn-helix transcriptional regulator [Eubacterium sp.]|nr:helix-turn-helix transcriptional regulator [Eubacterium sp.]
MSTNNDIAALMSNVFYNARKQRGLSQEEMAENLKISRREYQYIEHGQKCCSLETYSNFASFCDYDVIETLSSISEISKKNKE